jgi:hypothetical protein
MSEVQRATPQTSLTPPWDGNRTKRRASVCYIVYTMIWWIYDRVYGIYIYTHYIHSINIYIYNVSNLINSSFAKGHQQIWEGPIAYHTFVEIDVWQIWDASLKEQWMKMTYVHRYWYDINLKSGCCYLGRSYRWPHVCTMTDKECPSLTWFLLREFSRWLMCCSQVS